MPKIAEATDRWHAKEYEENSEFQYASAISYLEQLPIKANQKIIDIGCGVGKITAELAKRVYAGQVTGIDISKNMIKFAKQHYVSLGNLLFLEMDAQALQLGDDHLKPASYDWVVSFWTISWIKNHEELISGIAQCLKERGSIFLLVPLNNKLLENTFLTLREKMSWKSYFSCYQPPENNFHLDLYKSLMKKYGFLEASFKNETVEKEFPDKLSLRNFMRPWLPYIDPIPAPMWDHYLDEFVDLYLEQSYKDKYSIEFEVFTIRASFLPKQDLISDLKEEEVPRSTFRC